VPTGTFADPCYPRGITNGGSVSDEPRKKLELNLDAETARGKYANLAVVSHGRDEVILDFVAALPHHKPQVVSRIVLQRHQAEALARTLRRTLDQQQAGASPGAARSDEEPN